MTRSKLPGWSFMLLGIALMLYSRFIEAKTADTADPANLVVFFWAGVLILVFGLGREFRTRTRKPAPKKEEPFVKPQSQQVVHHRAHPAAHHHGQSPHTTHQHVRPVQHPSHPYEPSAKQCPRCHAPNRLHVQRCTGCGFQFY